MVGVLVGRLVGWLIVWLVDWLFGKFQRCKKVKPYYHGSCNLVVVLVNLKFVS